MSTPDQPAPPSGWGDAPEPPRYGQPAPGPTPPGGSGQPDYGRPGGQYGQGQYGQGQYGQYGQGQNPYGGSPYGPAAAKPGIVPLRPLTLGEIYDGAFSAIRHNPAVMLGAAALVLLVATVLGTLVGQLFVPPLASLFTEIFSSEPELAGFGNTYAQILAVGLGTSLTVLLAQPVVEGILTISVSQSVIGRKLALGEVWARLRPRVLVLIGWALLRSVAAAALVLGWFGLTVLLLAAGADDWLGAAVGLVLLLGLGLVVVLVWLGVRVGLVAPALALEGRGLGGTIARAWRLSRGSFWRLFGIYLLASIIVSVAASIVGYPINLAAGAVAAASGGGQPFAYLAILVLGTIVSTAITTIFMSSVVALLYVDVRMRREGLDVQLGAAAAAQQSGTGSGPGTAR